MRHRKAKVRLPQKPAHARMLKRNLVTSLLLYERVRTTKKRAQVIRPMVDQLITYAKKNSPHQSVRYINQVVTDKNASKKVMEVLKDRYASRSSGLTRMKPAGARTGDGAEIVDLELVDAVITIDEPAEEKKEKKIKKPEVKEEKSEEKVEKKEEKKAEKKEKKAKKEKVKASKKKSK